jgi:hypothetical protein
MLDTLRRTQISITEIHESCSFDKAYDEFKTLLDSILVLYHLYLTKVCYALPIRFLMRNEIRRNRYWHKTIPQFTCIFIRRSLTWSKKVPCTFPAYTNITSPNSSELVLNLDTLKVCGDMLALPRWLYFQMTLHMIRGPREFLHGIQD